MPTLRPSSTLGLLAAACCVLWTLAGGAEQLSSSDDTFTGQLERAKQAAKTSSWMNRSASPCTEFYEYACGKFKDVVQFDPRKPIPRSGSSKPFEYLLEDTVSMAADTVTKRQYELLVRPKFLRSPSDPGVDEMYTFAKNLFTSCSRWMFWRGFDASSPASELFSYLLQRLNEDMNSTDTIDTESLLAMLIKTGSGGLLKVWADIRLEVTSPAGTPQPVGVPSMSISMEDYPKGNFDLTLVVPFLANHANVLSINFTGREEVFAETLRALGDSVPNDSWLSECKVAGRDGTEKSVRKGDRVTVAQLDQLSRCAATAPSKAFKWSSLFNNLLDDNADAQSKEFHLSDVAAVVNFANFFKARESATGEEFLSSDGTIFLLLDWLLGFADYFPDSVSYRMAAQKVKTSYIRRPKSEHVVGCLELTGRLLTPIVSQMYHTAYVHSETIRKADNLFGQMVETTEKMIRGDSTSDESRSMPLGKVTHSIGFDSRSPSYLKDFYIPTLLNESSKPFGRLLDTAMRTNWLDKFQALYLGWRSASGFDKFSSLGIKSASMVNEQGAHIVLPLGLMTPPFFHPSFPNYINIGGIGVVIARELSAILRAKNAKFSQEGDTGRCLMKQYESIGNKVPWLTNRTGLLKLAETYPEDFSDVLAVRIATRRLSDSGSDDAEPALPDPLGLNLSHKKLLFISAAQTLCSKTDSPWLHYKYGNSPPKCNEHSIRVTGQMMNNNEFATTFGCNQGSVTASIGCTL